MKLRQQIDQNDTFSLGGHRIVHARTHKRKVPLWALNDTKVQALLLRSFPKLHTDARQQEAAGRWAAIIHLYFRMKYTRSQVAEEIGSTVIKVRDVLRSILRVSKGLRANGTGVLGAPKGRPKKRAT